MIKFQSFSKQFFNLKNKSIGISINSMINLPKHKFSSSSTSDEELVVFETKEDKELRFEDECYYFEREWSKLVQSKIDKHQDYVSPDLSDHQQREVDIMIQKVSHLSILEKKFFEYALNKSFKNTASVEPGKPNIFSLAHAPKVDTKINSDNPNWLATQKILSDLTPFLASGYFLGGAAAVAQEAKPAVEVVKEKEPEKLKAKVDVKLTSFDAAKKINLIKEIRSMFNLGLKEAKELVEKAPVMIKPGVARAEGEEIQKKLKEAGANIELA